MSLKKSLLLLVVPLIFISCSSDNTRNIDKDNKNSSISHASILKNIETDKQKKEEERFKRES